MPRPEFERQETIRKTLQGMQGIEPLKKLFWTELNYDRANVSLPRKGWGEQASAALAQDPVLFASGGDDFHVIYARLNSDKLLMGLERPVVSRMLRDHPYALFVFSTAKQDRWHFVNVKYEDDAQRRRLFRRITVGPEERLRTASERLDKVNLADTRDDAPITIQKLHDDAFDVEPVTEEFFREYRRVFEEVETAIRGKRDAEGKRLFTQRLFNRIMFLAFIQKKGWLNFNGDTDYLSALWRAYKILVVDVGAGSTDVGYMVRTVRPRDAQGTMRPLLIWLPAADALEIAGRWLTDKILNDFKQQGRRETPAEAEEYKINNLAWRTSFDLVTRSL